MEQAIQESSPDIVIHLGDHIDDARRIKAKFSDLTYHMVKGNTDFMTPGDNELLLQFGELKFFMTHGHVYRVKDDLSRLVHRAKEVGVDLALFGHTHNACVIKEHGITFMNPGQLEHHHERRKASYGMVTIEDGSFECNIVYLPGDQYDW